MPISPLGVGDGRPQHWTFTTDSGIFTLFGLQNNNIALHTQDMNNNYALYVCTGAWAITGDGSAGKADFTPSLADLTTGYLGHASLYKVYPVVTLSSGPVPMDSQTIVVEDRP